MEAVPPSAIPATGPGPLILTAQLDPAAQARFDRERFEHFPAGRTVIGAHVTLFHAVPAAVEPTVREDLTASSNRPPFDLVVSELMSLGRGVAYRLQSAELVTLHRRLQSRWWQHLTAQDRQGFRPHVTVQNKASPEVASRTLARLAVGFEPFTVRAIGLRLWRYEGGPWSELARFPFIG